MEKETMSKEELKIAKDEARKLLKKPFYKKWWVWLVTVVILVAVAGGAGSGGEVSNKPINETGTKVETPDKPKEEIKEEVKVAGIGDVVKVGNVDFTVNGTSTNKKIGGDYGQKAQGTYLIIDVTVKNNGDEAITTDSSFFKLKSGTKTFDADSVAGVYANPDANFFLEKVNPDSSAKGFVVFDVSDEVIASTDLLLQVQSGYFGIQTGIIKIAK